MVALLAHRNGVFLDGFDPLSEGFQLDVGLRIQDLYERLRGVEVLQLCLGTEFLLTIRAKGDIGIHTHRTLFHLNVRNTSVLDNLLEGC